MAFLHLVNNVRDVFEDKFRILTRCNEAKFFKVDLNGLRDMHDISTSGNYEGKKKQVQSKGNIPKQRKIIRNC